MRQLSVEGAEGRRFRRAGIGEIGAPSAVEGAEFGQGQVRAVGIADEAVKLTREQTEVDFSGAGAELLD